MKFYEEQLQSLRLKMSEARIQAEIALKEKALAEGKSLERERELRGARKRLLREEEARGQLEEHLTLLEQKFSHPSKLAVLRGQALQNARAELRQLREYLQEKDQTVGALEEQLGDLRSQDERTVEPYARELQALALESQRKEILLASVKQQA